MLTFFRKVRKGLLGSGQAKRYLLYATGEVLLVMIGILLALQVNNRNEWRKDRITERSVLSEIRENLKICQEALEGHYGYVDFHQNKTKIIIKHMKYDLPYHDSLDQHFYNLHSTPQPKFSTSGFENLKLIGIEIISNQELREEIVKLLDEVLPQVEQNIRQDGWFRLIEYHNTEYIEHFKILSADHNDEFFNRENYLGTSSVARPNDYSQLVRDDRYESILRSIYDNQSWFKNYINWTKDRVATVEELIDAELKEKE